MGAAGVIGSLPPIMQVLHIQRVFSIRIHYAGTNQILCFLFLRIFDREFAAIVIFELFVDVLILFHLELDQLKHLLEMFVPDFE